MFRSIQNVSPWKPTKVLDSGLVVKNNRRYVYVVLSDPDIAKAIGIQYMILVETQCGNQVELRMKVMSDPAVHVTLDTGPHAAASDKHRCD